MSRASLDIKPKREAKERVLLDLDGVIRDFVGSLIRVYNREYPDHQVQPVTSRELEKYFPIKEKIYPFMESGNIKEILEDAEPYPGALEALHHWRDEFEIVVVTSQTEVGRSPTLSWIGKNDIPTNEVHISHYKSEIDGIALLDDFQDNLEVFAATGRLAVCLDQPWNQQWNGPRVETVHQFFDYVQEFLYKHEKKDRGQNYLI